MVVNIPYIFNNKFLILSRSLSCTSHLASKIFTITPLISMFCGTLCILLIYFEYFISVVTRNGVCFFPFSYNGNSYSNCTNVDNGGTFWCSLTDNYNRDGQLGICNDFSNCRGKFFFFFKLSFTYYQLQ